MENLTLENVQTIIRTMANVAIENEKRFSDLDGVMGDADFGTSIAGGYRAVLAEWEGYDMSSIGSFLLNVAKTWTGNTGGCSGPVWGTLFMRCGMAFRGKTEISIEEAIPALKNAMEGIMQRGGAKLGDKTMLDAIDAIVKSFEASVEAGDSLSDALSKAADAAYEMRETTKDWVAMRGRQSFTGDRSRGTYDPGIVAVGDFAKEIVAALS
ncbi:MAG: dihydroxyacetone kinase subunit DhaL [Oscillospiraceae bacterium]|nr:dihydroxyacetone kinase subunit DhaL [Oscillospiraceae bacterium]